MRSSRRFVSIAAIATVLLGGCSNDEPARDPDLLVLHPPADGAVHTHARVLGDGTDPVVAGYRLADVRLPHGTDGPGTLSFRVLGPGGRAVTRYETEQTKLMHVYVVRSDYAVYRHVHPTLSDDGTWTGPVDLGEPGDYRVIADFRPAGSQDLVVLGADAVVPGRWRAASAASPTDGDDGVVRVRVEGTGQVGADRRLRMLVSTLDGRAVPLGSYLGATAHVSGFRFAARAPGRTFVHVHPDGAEDTDAGTELTFHTTFEQAGTYRFFVQVRVGGLVHTVPVTATVSRS